MRHQPEFVRFARAIRAIQLDDALYVDIKATEENKKALATLRVRPDRMQEETLEEWNAVKQALSLPADVNQFRIMYDSMTDEVGTIAIKTRSVMNLLVALAPSPCRCPH